MGKFSKNQISIASIIILSISSINILTALAFGEIEWNPDGLIIADALGETTSTPANQNSPQAVRTSDGDFVIVWADERNESDFDIYAQKIDRAGTKKWAENGAPVVTANENQPKNDKIAITASNDGGVIIAWTDERNYGSVYAQKLSSNGTTLWTTNGVLIEEHGENPILINDNTGGTYIIFEKYIDEDNYAYITHILSNGSIDQKYTPSILIGDGYYYNYNQKTFWSDDKNIIISFVTSRDSESFITVTKFNTEIAEKTWTTDAIIEPEQNKLSGDYDIATDNFGGAYVITEEQISGYANLHVQRITNSGTSLAPSIKIITSNTQYNQTNPQIISDNIGAPSGAIISFEDKKLGTNTDIYVQRIDNNLNTKWGENGVAISKTDDNKDQTNHQLISNGANGAIIIFKDNQTSYTDILAQHINSSGETMWTKGGETIETNNTTNHTDDEAIAVSAGNGDALIAWTRQPGLGAKTDIHAQYIKDTVGSICSETTNSSFCGSQRISNYILSFTNIPSSLNFGTITTGSTSYHCNNTSTLQEASNICSDQLNLNSPSADDKLSVLDERNSGGFIVQVTTQGIFTDGTNEIPLQNLYLITTIDESDTNKANGVNYSEDFIGPKTINASLYINESTEDISDPATYMQNWTSQPSPWSALKISQFGGYPLDIMNGQLSVGSGRIGEASIYTNFLLKIDPNQLPGDYSLILTYDLTDNTIHY